MRSKSNEAAHAHLAPAARLRAIFLENNDLLRECAAINLNRIIYCAPVALLIDLASIIAFSLRTPGGAAEAFWRAEIILCHAVLLALMAGYGLTAWKLRHSEHIMAARILQLAVTSTLLSIGIAIAVVDQNVTTNITPYLLVCMIVGAAFLIRPSLSALLFAASFAAFYFAIDRGADPDIILSNRSNGMAAAAIGFGLSLAMWGHFKVEIRQRRQIEAQRGELERVNRELQNMAFTDSLTGLPNRRYFDQAVARELAAIGRGGPSAGIIEFDLDFFKEINDKNGHAAGDEVLRRIAPLVSGAIRKADVFARYGGEEFILLLPGTGLAGAAATAEKLRRLIESNVVLADGSEVRLTASFGVAELNAGSAINCYRSVDQALYRAKQKGRNRVEVLAPGDLESLADMAEIPAGSRAEAFAPDGPESLADAAGAPTGSRAEVLAPNPKSA